LGFWEMVHGVPVAAIGGGSAAEAVVVVPGAVIESGEDAFGPAGGDEFFEDIGFSRAVGDCAVGVFAGPEAVAGDVFGGEDGVVHSGIAGDGDPLVHVELVGSVEGERIVAVGEFFSGEGAHAEVDEHAIAEGFPLAKPLKREPLASGGGFGGSGGGFRVGFFGRCRHGFLCRENRGTNRTLQKHATVGFHRVIS